MEELARALIKVEKDFWLVDSLLKSRLNSKLVNLGLSCMRSAKFLGAVFMFAHPTRRKAIQASQAPMPSVAFCCLAAYRNFMRRPPPLPKLFLRSATYNLQRSSLKESQRSTRTECPRASRIALGESPRTSVLWTALSATNRHRSAASYHFGTSYSIFPSLLFLSAFLTLQMEELTIGR